MTTAAPQSTGTAPPRGVMGAEYARGRQAKLHLAFRMRSRALTAADAFRRLRPTVNRPTILDLGAAEGATLAEVHRLLDAEASLGIEYAQELIDEAPTLPDGCRLVQGDVTQAHPEVELESYDLVIALAVLEHLAEPEAMMTQVHRALRPGGLLVASCPAGMWDQISGWLRLHAEEHHEGVIDDERFEHLARQGSLVPLEYRRFMFAPVGFLPYLRINVSPERAMRIDRLVGALRVLDILCVNQLFVAGKPRSRLSSVPSP